MIEIEGTISNQPIYVLIDPRDSLSYIGPHVVEKHKLKTEEYRTTSLVHLATRTKQRVTGHAKKSHIDLNVCFTIVNINALPLRSYAY